MAQISTSMHLHSIRIFMSLYSLNRQFYIKNNFCINLNTSSIYLVYELSSANTFMEFECTFVPFMLKLCWLGHLYSALMKWWNQQWIQLVSMQISINLMSHTEQHRFIYIYIYTKWKIPRMRSRSACHTHCIW